MLVDTTDRLVKGHRRQSTALDISQEIVAVPKMSLAVGGTGGKAAEIVEWLVMRLKVCGAVLTRIDDATLLAGRSHAVGNGYAPATAIPGPVDALGRQCVTNRLVGLRWQRPADALGSLGIGEIEGAIAGGWNPAWLKPGLRRVDGKAVGRHLTAKAAGKGSHGTVTSGRRAGLLGGLPLPSRTGRMDSGASA